jgi:hypothetical protein
MRQSPFLRKKEKCVLVDRHVIYEHALGVVQWQAGTRRPFRGGESARASLLAVVGRVEPSTKGQKCAAPCAGVIRFRPHREPEVRALPGARARTRPRPGQQQGDRQGREKILSIGGRCSLEMALKRFTHSLRQARAHTSILPLPNVLAQTLSNCRRQLQRELFDGAIWNLRHACSLGMRLCGMPSSFVVTRARARRLLTKVLEGDRVWLS